MVNLLPCEGPRLSLDVVRRKVVFQPEVRSVDVPLELRELAELEYQHAHGARFGNSLLYVQLESASVMRREGYTASGTSFCNIVSI